MADDICQIGAAIETWLISMTYNVLHEMNRIRNYNWTNNKYERWIYLAVSHGCIKSLLWIHVRIDVHLGIW